MTDSDPFADLGDTLEDSDEESVSAESSTAESQSSTSDSNQTNDSLTDTAFSYEAAQQRPFYARASTIDDFDSWLNYELERELNDRGYQNIVVREMTDALLRTVVEEDLVEDVAQRFESARNNATNTGSEQFE
ncbi:hypothetical protein [Halalkalicoccus tibetensis]|uniref:CopG family transcriptional regulator n=1 Tax=Halalkalicoccus tibetensis TaxID=175632 RepID=A0ABD5VBC7_9EURY